MKYTHESTAPNSSEETSQSINGLDYNSDIVEAEDVNKDTQNVYWGLGSDSLPSDVFYGQRNMNGELESDPLARELDEYAKERIEYKDAVEQRVAERQVDERNNTLLEKRKINNDAVTYAALNGVQSLDELKANETSEAPREDDIFVKSDLSHLENMVASNGGNGSAAQAIEGARSSVLPSKTFYEQLDRNKGLGPDLPATELDSNAEAKNALGENIEERYEQESKTFEVDFAYLQAGFGILKEKYEDGEDVLDDYCGLLSESFTCFDNVSDFTVRGASNALRETAGIMREAQDSIETAIEELPGADETIGEIYDDDSYLPLEGLLALERIENTEMELSNDADVVKHCEELKKLLASSETPSAQDLEEVKSLVLFINDACEKNNAETLTYRDFLDDEEEKIEGYIKNSQRHVDEEKELPIDSEPDYDALAQKALILKAKMEQQEDNNAQDAIA